MLRTLPNEDRFYTKNIIFSLNEILYALIFSLYLNDKNALSLLIRLIVLISITLFGLKVRRNLRESIFIISFGFILSSLRHILRVGKFEIFLDFVVSNDDDVNWSMLLWKEFMVAFCQVVLVWFIDFYEKPFTFNCKGSMISAQDDVIEQPFYEIVSSQNEYSLTLKDLRLRFQLGSLKPAPNRRTGNNFESSATLLRRMRMLGRQRQQNILPI